jgi:hypothetical protein
MSNFMGPMAPPPAAPGQPPQLDFQTDPNQRQRFKQFMRQRMQPPMPQMPAPMPMAPAAQPMPYMGNNIDIFAPQPMAFAQGGSVSDALADALSNDIGDYSADDTMTDLSQTSYNDFDPGGNESFDAAAMDQFRNKQVSDLSSTIGQQIQSVISSNQQMGTPAPVPQSRIEQRQFESLQNVPTTEPVFSMPSLNLGGKSVTFDLLGNPLTIGFEDGGSVPPRETDIRGMHHELSYITPDEADILMALGGSGEPGPMGIPSYRPGGDDVGSENAGSGDHSGGPGSASSADSSNASDDDMGDVGIMEGPGYSGPDDTDSVEVAQDQQDMGFDIFDSVDDFNAVNLSKPGTLGQSYDMNAINRNRQERMNRQEILDNTLENEIETGKVSKGTAVNDGDIESLDALTNAVESSSKIGGTNTGNNLLGSDDLLGLPDELTGTPMTNTVKGSTVVGSSDPETYDPDLDQATKNALANIGVNQSVIDKISRGSSQSGLESEGVLGALGIGPGAAYKGSVNNRFGTATGPGRLSTVTAEEMEALRTGNAVQRQMYRQLAGIKSAGPVLSSFDPNNVKDPNILDSIFGVTNKPSSAIEVFRAPITEQKGFKSVNTGTFKDGIAGVTGMGNTPGVIGGIMQMFGIDPIVYTGDNRFDPNRPSEDFGGGGDDNILLPLKPEEVAPESTDPNQIGGIGTPGSPIAAGPVVVPSNRTSAPFSGQMPVGYGTPQTGQINPYSLSEMQRYQQMLARLGQAKSPIGLADGGSVLDAAAGRFLESLTAA